jgi:hypothetical protein
MYVCEYIYVCVCICACVYVYMCVCTCVSMYYVRICMYVRMYAYTNVMAPPAAST